MEDGILDENVGGVGFQGDVVVAARDGPVPERNTVGVECIDAVGVSCRRLE